MKVVFKASFHTFLSLNKTGGCIFGVLLEMPLFSNKTVYISIGYITYVGVKIAELKEDIRISNPKAIDV
jgi:hypothetical protein|tara:strand:+ start:710 stop:916 length:207 start_codon:yes stop_codon:yes gene_type:complete